MTDSSASPQLSLDRDHSHSDMTRYLEEVVAYAKTLRTDDADVPELLDEIWNYVTEFSVEMREHAQQEERDLFPDPDDDRLATSTRLLLERIYDEHRNLKNLTDELLETLRRARRTSQDLSPDLAETIFVRSRLLRYKFELHSRNERRYFDLTESSV